MEGPLPPRMHMEVESYHCFHHPGYITENCSCFMVAAAQVPSRVTSQEEEVRIQAGADAGMLSFDSFLFTIRIYISLEFFFS